MYVIFLDIDGVLSPITNSSNQESHFGYQVQFSPKAVANLKSLLEKSQAKIVLSSRWVGRIGFQATVLALATHGITGPYVLPEDVGEKEKVYPSDWMNKESNGKFYGVCVTPKKFTSEKGHEISMWLSDYSSKIKGYVVLDDDAIFFQEDYQVQTDGDIGLTEKNVEEALKILNQGMKKYKAERKKRLRK